VLFDRDGTLIENVPYNGDPGLVVPMPEAREAVDRLRAAGLPVAVVSNQSAIGRGWLTPEDVQSVNARVEELLGPFDWWAVCPHAPDEGCDCRKPAPGLILDTAARLGVDPTECLVVGDSISDMEAARSAGAHGVLVVPAGAAFEADSSFPVAHDLADVVALAVDAARARSV
jgi:HAD superfamily hydrolase (TIGR01662 family)